MTGPDAAEQPTLFPTAVEAPDPYEVDELENMRRRLEQSGRYRVLERLPRRAGYADRRPDAGTPIHTGVYLDVETTGLEPSDRIIELGLVAFEYDDDGNVYRVLEELEAFEDPGRAVPREITELTGITTEDVRGKRIPDERVSAFVGSADLVIAHNAAFDRPFVEARLPVFESLAWACSASDIEWRRHGFSGRNLEYLAMKRGFVYDGHRAINDCLAGLELLALPLALDGGPSALASLLTSTGRSTVRLWATDSPFASKDLLKARSYRWNAGKKTWWRDLPDEGFDEELSWLARSVYGNRPPLPYLEIDATRRYSARIPDDPPADAPRR